ncbi:MAG: sulfatase [Planctomycetota bacterium]
MRHPHLIQIVIDDLGWADLGCYGSSFYDTPNLDRLAARGVRFTDAYASCPVCSPTRASLMTGRYPARVGITNYIRGNAWGRLMGVPYFDRLPKTERTVAQLLGEAGYRTAHVGKWHLGGAGYWPNDFGFDVNVGGCDMGCPSTYFSPYDIPTLPDGPAGEYLTDRLTGEALAIVAEHAPGGPRAATPLFLNLWHYAVHTPIQAPPALVEKYEARARERGLDPAAALVEGEAFSCLHKKDERIVRRTVQSDPAYAAMVENLDTNLGRLFDALEASGMWDDCLVLFTSDNGGLSTAEGSPTCNAPLSEGKGWMTDGGNRVCLIAAGGAVAAGMVCPTPVTSPDLMTTLLDAAGLTPPTDVEIDGRSFLPLLRGETMERGPIFWHYPHYSNQGGTPSAAVRDGDFKLTETFEDSRLQLFDVRRDPGETHDLSETRPELRDRLHASLRAWSASIEAVTPPVNPYHDDMRTGRRPCADGLGRVPGDDRLSVTAVAP